MRFYLCIYLTYMKWSLFFYTEIVISELFYINQMTFSLIIQFDCQIFRHIIHQIFNQRHKNKVFAFVYPAKKYFFMI